MRRPETLNGRSNCQSLFNLTNQIGQNYISAQHGSAIAAAPLHNTVKWLAEFNGDWQLVHAAYWWNNKPLIGQIKNVLPRPLKVSGLQRHLSWSVRCTWRAFSFLTDCSRGEFICLIYQLSCKVLLKNSPTRLISMCCVLIKKPNSVQTDLAPDMKLESDGAGLLTWTLVSVLASWYRWT